MDRSTVMRRFLSKAVRDWLIERSLKERIAEKGFWVSAELGTLFYKTPDKLEKND